MLAVKKDCRSDKESSAVLEFISHSLGKKKKQTNKQTINHTVRQK